MRVKPFQWKNLKKVSREEIAFTRALFEFLPAMGIREQFCLALRKTFKEHLGEEALFFLEDIGNQTFRDFYKGIGDVPILVVIGMEPIDRKAIIHVDHHMAHLIIDRLLGGRGDIDQDVRKLSETEQGVLQYLIMQLMSKVYKLCGSSPRVHFRFEKFAFDSKEIKHLASKEDVVTVVTLKMNCFEQSGFVQIAFPNAFIQEAFLNDGAFDSRRRPEETKYFLKQMERYGFIRASVWADGGRVTLSTDELKDLEPGDVLLLDESGLTLKNGKIDGDVTIRVGGGEGGGIRANIKDGKRRLKVEVVGRG